MDSYGLDRDAPIIWAADWERWHAEGWRWECNLPVGRRIGNGIDICALQRHHGKCNVTIGHPWMGLEPSPDSALILVGIYVRDIVNLVNALYEWMNDGTLP